jgi:hypothetical protein
MLFEKTIAVNFNNHTKFINTTFGGNTELMLKLAKFQVHTAAGMKLTAR